MLNHIHLRGFLVSVSLESKNTKYFLFSPSHMWRFDVLIQNSWYYCEYLGMYCFTLLFAFNCNIDWLKERFHNKIEQWNCCCSCIQPICFSFFFSPVRILSSTQIMIWPTPCGRMCRCRFTCLSTSFTSSTLRRSCRERSPWWSREGPMCTGTRPLPQSTSWTVTRTLCVSCVNKSFSQL